jgi:Tfp pilus assembly protein PilP
MNRERLHRLLLGLATVGISLSLAFSSARGADQATPATGGQPAASDESEKAKDEQNNKTIEKIIEESENVLAGRGFTYDPAGRRDPFRSLVEQTKADKGPRPKGITGMLISEVDLVGIVQKDRDNLAFFNGSDNKGYFLRVGDQLYDGRIIQINRHTGQVVFRQEISDPRSIKPYRDITKRLYSVEEEKT